MHVPYADWTLPTYHSQVELKFGKEIAYLWKLNSESLYMSQ